MKTGTTKQRLWGLDGYGGGVQARRGTDLLSMRCSDAALQACGFPPFPGLLHIPHVTILTKAVDFRVLFYRQNLIIQLGIPPSEEPAGLPEKSASVATPLLRTLATSFSFALV